MTPRWTVACQAPLSMGFFRQEYWSGLPFPSPGDLPDPGIELVSPVSLALQVDSLPAKPSRKPNIYVCQYICVCIPTHTHTYLYRERETHAYTHTHTHIYIYIAHLLYPFITDGHLGCFPILTIVNTAAVTIGVPLSF